MTEEGRFITIECNSSTDSKGNDVTVCHGPAVINVDKIASVVCGGILRDRCYIGLSNGYTLRVATEVGHDLQKRLQNMK
jgi:hypothetical protein